MSPLRQRVHNLRRRLIAASVALFIALFAGITVQLASGNDPALSSGTSTKAGVTQQATPSTVSASQTTSVAPVTTSQS